MEKHILKAFNDNFDDWDFENKLTEIIENIWPHLSEATQKTLKQWYLILFINNSRLDRFPQKRFAKYLIEQKITSAAEIEEWIRNQIEVAKKNYLGSINKDTISWLTSAYFSLSPYISKSWNLFLQSL